MTKEMFEKTKKGDIIHITSSHACKGMYGRMDHIQGNYIYVRFVKKFDTKQYGKTDIVPVHYKACRNGENSGEYDVAIKDFSRKIQNLCKQYEGLVDYSIANKKHRVIELVEV